MSIIDNVKEIADLVKKAGDIDLYRRIVGLEGEVLDLSRRNRELEYKIEELREVVDISKKLVFKAPFYWIPDDKIPFCSKCWEENKKPIHMLLTDPDSRYYACPVCDFGTTL
jgi:hypothetical protein